MKIQQLTYREAWLISWSMLFGCLIGVFVVYASMGDYISPFLVSGCVGLVAVIGLIITKILCKLLKIEEPKGK